MLVALLQVSVQTASRTTMESSLLVDASLAGMCLVLVATFGLVWRLNEKMGKVYGAVFDRPYGAVVLLQQMAHQLDAMDRRVSALERRTD